MSAPLINETNLTKGNNISWGLQDDLAIVACYAAGEVDNLIMGRPNGFSALKRLLEMIQSSIISSNESTSPQSLIDPTTAVAMNRALEHSYPTLKESLSTVDQLIEQSGVVAELLDRVIKEPQKFQKHQGKDLETLRSLCLSLSNNALACEEPIEEIQQQAL